MSNPDAHPLSVRIALPVLRAVVWLPFLLLGPIKVRGRRRVPREGGLLIVSNHQSDIDPVLVQLACPRPIHFVAKEELFKIPVIGAFMRWFRAFPIKRGTPDRSALRRAAELIRAGEVVCVFPEGRLSKSGDLLPILPGAALVARESGARCIGLSISGSRRIMPYGKVIPRPALRTVNIVWSEVAESNQLVEEEPFKTWAEEQLRRALSSI